MRAGKIRAKAAAVGAAMAALSDEVEARTIRRTDEGKLTAKAPDVIRAGYPVIAPAVDAAAGLVMSMDAAKARIAADRRELEDERRALLKGQMQLMKAAEEVETMRQKLRRALSRVVEWLRRPELAEDMRKEGYELLRDARPLLSTEQLAPDRDSGPVF